MFAKILAYLGQDSTWRGIIAVVTAVGSVFGFNVSPELGAKIMAAGIGLIGVINILRDQDKKTPPPSA